MPLAAGFLRLQHRRIEVREEPWHILAEKRGKYSAG